MAKPAARRARTTTSVRPRKTGGGITRLAGSRDGMAPARVPVGGSALGLGADVSGALEAIAPTFGNVLSAIGQGVASSQAALDKGVIDTVKALGDTKITVVSEVVETLDDDGLPDVEQTQLVTQQVSVLNYVTPTVHEWKHVALSMDMQVAAFDAESAMTVSVSQHRLSAANAGLLFGFIGVGYYHDSSSYQSMMANSHSESQWAQGQVTLDAVLGPRRTTKFPVPATVTVGPQVFFSQGAVVEKKTGGAVTERSIDVLIAVRKSSGAPNPDASLVLDAAGLLPSFKSDGGFAGSTTNAEGKCLVTLRRAIPNPFFAQAAQRTVTVALGDIRKSFQVTI